MTQGRSRGTREMVHALERHVRLLRQYATQAFQEGNPDYAGEVAGKLRLLVTEFRSNRPLLLNLIAAAGIDPLITLGGPPVDPLPGEPRPGDKITLRQYLDLGAVGIRIPSGEFIMLSKVQLIRAWAEQTGASHEDWTVDPVLDTILSAGLYIGGLPAAVAELRVTTNTVLHVADQFLSAYGVRETGENEASGRERSEGGTGTP